MTGTSVSHMATSTLAPVRAVADQSMAWRTPTIDVDATVQEGQDLMRRTGQRILLVTSGSLPVGVVTKSELWSAGAGPASEGRIGDVLRLELVRIAPWTDVEGTLLRYRDAAWASLFRRRPGRWVQEGAPCTS